MGEAKNEKSRTGDKSVFGVLQGTIYQSRYTFPNVMR
jgi:hypothetical protein